MSKLVNVFYGPTICGDGVDVFNNYLLTSSWSQSNQLSLWNIKTGKLAVSVDWNSTLKTSNDPIFLYAGQFSKLDGNLILVGVIVGGGQQRQRVQGLRHDFGLQVHLRRHRHLQGNRHR